MVMIGKKSLLVLVVALFGSTLLLASTADAQRTRIGGAIWGGGSVTYAYIEFGDESAFVISPQSQCSSYAFKAKYFFDAKSEPRNAGNTINCRYIPNPLDYPDRWTQAKCEMHVTCHCFRIGNCVSGRRINQMKCPTRVAGENVAGCEGSISVDPIRGVSDPKILPSADGVTGVRLELKLPSSLAKRSDCATAFPYDAFPYDRENPFAPEFLAERVIGEIEQVCSGGFSEADPVVKDKLRGFARAVRSIKDPSARLVARHANFKLATKWAEGIDATCTPSNVDGPKSCPKNEGGLWIAVSGQLPKAFDIEAAVKNPELLKCSRNAAPRRCLIEEGKLRCLCPICDPDTGVYLVNENLYTLNQVKAEPKWSAICPIKVNAER
jgi:hypothetical protein